MFTTIPLSPTQHQLALRFSGRYPHPFWDKANLIYLRILAVCAVDSYVSALGFDTNLKASDSFNLMGQLALDTSDLETSLGKLECLPVLPGEQTVQIPEDSLFDSDRIAYVAVGLDESLREAKLLGFTESVNQDEIPLSQFKSPDDLPAHLFKISQFEPSKTQVEFKHWFQKNFEHGWQSFEAFGFEQSDESDGASVKGAKLIDLGHQSVLLLIAASEGICGQVAVQAYVYPFAGTYLPPNLRLVLCSKLGVVLHEVQARSQDRCIKLRRFEFEEEAVFSIQLAFEDAVVTETFVNNY